MSGVAEASDDFNDDNMSPRSTEDDETNVRDTEIKEVDIGDQSVPENRKSEGKGKPITRPPLRKSLSSPSTLDIQMAINYKGGIGNNVSI